MEVHVKWLENCKITHIRKFAVLVGLEVGWDKVLNEQGERRRGSKFWSFFNNVII